MSSDVHEWFGAAFLIALSAASALCYRRDHAERSYADGTRAAMPSPKEFALVYAYIRYSTLVAGVGALLFGAPSGDAGSTWQGIWLVPHRSTVAIYAGMAAATLGFVMFVAARRALGRHYSPCYQSYVPTAIVQSGPYARVRHPIYTANQIVLLGLFVLTGSLWIAASWLLLAYYYTRSAVAEERRLVQEHREYASYLQRTGRFLPKPRRWRRAS